VEGIVLITRYQLTSPMNLKQVLTPGLVNQLTVNTLNLFRQPKWQSEKAPFPYSLLLSLG